MAFQLDSGRGLDRRLHFPDRPARSEAVLQGDQAVPVNGDVSVRSVRLKALGDHPASLAVFVLAFAKPTDVRGQGQIPDTLRQAK